MFIDEVILTCKAGMGGNGIISWRKEKYIPKGGPFGGDGGKGGDIVLRTTTHETTLVKFRHLKLIKGENGERGGTQEMHGADAADTILEVPIGTIVTDIETGELIVDLSKPGETFVLCEGGRGGFGNAHFKGSTRQAPNFAELGDVGEHIEVKLELKLVADVGLVGLPNAGKSTLIQSLTNVRPKIAPYPFTTLIPNLGVMEWKDRSLVIEDVPGLIEGASEGKGLGFQFLKHIDRCRVIIHLLDASQGEEAIIANYKTIRKELQNWSEEMGKKEEFIILSKCELVDGEQLEEMVENFKKATKKSITLTISAGAYIRIDDLKDLLLERIPNTEKYTPPLLEDADGHLIESVVPSAPKIYDLKHRTDSRRVKIERRPDGDFDVSGERIEEIVRMTNMSYIDGVNRIYDVMEKLGVIRKIKTMILSDLTENKATDDKNGLGFFEGEDDVPTPNVWIAEKKFSLENIIFMKGEQS